MRKEPLKEYKYQEKLDLRKVDGSLPELRKINCPSCATTIPAAHLNIQTNIAKCNSCDGIFSFQEMAEQLSNEQHLTQEILQPEGVELSHFKNELDISVQQPWTNLEIVSMSFFSFFMYIFMAVFTSTYQELGGFGKALGVGMIITLIVGFVTYFFIRKKHKIYVHIDEEHLSVERRPKKFIKDKRYVIRDIDQVYIKNIVSGGTPKGCGIYMIVNETAGQKHVELIKSVKSRSKAKYIEQEIEKHLGIKDRRVPDEES